MLIWGLSGDGDLVVANPETGEEWHYPPEDALKLMHFIAENFGKDEFLC
jgi:hypothetical protein